MRQLYGTAAHQAVSWAAGIEPRMTVYYNGIPPLPPTRPGMLSVH